MHNSPLHEYGLNPVFPEVIDSSMLRAFMDCPSMFYLRYVLGLKKRWRLPSAEAHFDWGTSWHKILEVYRKTGDPVQGLQTLQNFPDSLTSNDPKGRTKERMAKIFFRYVEKYSDEDLLEYDFLRGEQFFDVYDDEIGFKWCGRVDEVRRRKRNGKIVVWDYKTASKMGQGYFESHEYGFQFPGYVWAMNQILTDPVEEICVDVNYTTKTQQEFFRRTFRYTPQKLAEWVGNVKRIVDEMKELGEKHLHEPEAWKKNWNECTRYGLCPYTDIHFLAPIGDTRLRVLQEDFYEQRWDPRGLLEEDD